MERYSHFQTIAARTAWMLLIAASSLGSDVKEPLRETLIGGLRWYFRWAESLPQATHFICRGKEIGDEYFVYCDPGMVTLEIERSKRGAGLNLQFMGSTPDDYPKAFQWFQLGRKGASVRRSLQAVLKMEEVVRYEFDDRKSSEWMNVTKPYMQRYVRLLQERGRHVQVLFPRVSKGDLFYHVYVIDTGEVDSVCEFAVIDGIMQDHPKWSYDRPHHSIPLDAQSYAADSQRWYASFPASPAK